MSPPLQADHSGTHNYNPIKISDVMMQPPCALSGRLWQMDVGRSAHLHKHTEHSTHDLIGSSGTHTALPRGLDKSIYRACRVYQADES